MPGSPKPSRREFLKKSSAAAFLAGAFPTILPSSVFGANAPSNRVTLGCIGIGRQGMGDMKSLMNLCDVVAVCDVDSNRAKNAKNVIENNYKKRTPSARYKGCAMYDDFRELLARDDIDAVMICTADHWHALPAIAAARAGKDVFLQKPMTLTHEEGRVLVETVRRYGRVLQVGSQQRSDSRFRFACELVRNGRIGDLKSVKVGVGRDGFAPVLPATKPPSNLNYDMWLGPAPEVPYIEKRVHPQNGYGRPGWMCTYDYTLGMVANWGAHHMDITHWGMGMEHSGPVEIEATTEYAKDGVWTVHGAFGITYLYPNGIPVNFTGGGKNKQGVLFEGTNGWIRVRRGFIDAHPKSLLTSVIAPNELHLYESHNHKQNFIDCIKSRLDPVAPVDNGHRSNTVCILADIAMRLGRKIKWDPEREQFINDEEATRMLARPMRAPWKLT